MARDFSPIESYRVVEPVEYASNASFGRVFAVVFALIGLWPLLYRLPPRWWALSIGLIFLATSIVIPRALTPLNWVWMRFGALLHRIVSPVMLGMVFFGVVLPIGLYRRLRRSDRLGLARQPDAKTYWVVRDPPGPDPSTLKNQF